MVSRNCKKVISQASDGAITEAEAGKFLEIITNRAKRRKLGGDSKTLRDIMREEGDFQIKENQINGMMAAREAKMQALKFLENKDRMADAGSRIVGLKSILGGQAGFIRSSVDVDQKAIRGETLGRLFQRLNEKDLLSTFNKDEVQQALARELFELSSPNPKPSPSGNPRAAEIAVIVHEEMKIMTGKINSAGGWIRNLDGYITRQSHDAQKMREVGFDGWIRFIDDKIDRNRTFYERGIEEGDELNFLQEVYENLITGNHQKHGTKNFDTKLQNLNGMSNIAKRGAHERVLHFKDADSWHAYNQDFGTKSIQLSVVRSLEFMADDLGLMQNLGPNPHTMLASLRQSAIDELKKVASGGETEKIRKSAQREIDQIEGGELDNLMAVLDGSIDMAAPGGETLARVSANFRAGVRMSTSGGTVLSSLTDWHSVASELRYQGESYLGHLFKGITRMGIGMGKAEKNEMYRLIGVAANHMVGEYHHRFDADGGVPGQRAKLEWMYYTFNGQRKWDEFQKAGAAFMMLTHMATESKKSWTGMNENLRHVMGLYEIDEVQWNLMGDLVRRGEDGVDYVTPELASKITDTRISQITGLTDDAEILAFRDRFERNIRAYVFDRTEHAVPTPGANERAVLMQNTMAGTAIGEALRHFSVYKSFPTTMLSKIMMRDTVGQIGGVDQTRTGFAGFREALTKGEGFGGFAENVVEGLTSGKGAIGAMTHSMIGLTALGYLAMTAKDLAKGRTPRDPNNKDTWFAAMGQGGGLSIYGDFLFGEFNRFGVSPLETFAGPSANVFSDFATLYAKFRDGDDTAATAMRVFKNNSGFLASFPGPGKYVGKAAVLSNMFYTKNAMDFLFYYQLQEMMNPGYLDRMRKRMKKEQGQELIIDPVGN